MFTLMTELKRRAIIIAISAMCFLVAVARFLVPSHELSWAGAYEAVAHLFVGALLGAFLVSRDKNYLYMLLALSCVEMIAFLGGLA